jgi:hypothetical protein
VTCYICELAHTYDVLTQVRPSIIRNRFPDGKNRLGNGEVYISAETMIKLLDITPIESITSALDLQGIKDELTPKQQRLQARLFLLSALAGYTAPKGERFFETYDVLSKRRNDQWLAAGSMPTAPTKPAARGKAAAATKPAARGKKDANNGKPKEPKEPCVYWKCNIGPSLKHDRDGKSVLELFEPLRAQHRRSMREDVAAFYKATAPFDHTNLCLAGGAGASTKGHADWSEAFNTAFALTFGNDTEEQV